MKNSYSYLLVAGLLAGAAGTAQAQNWLGGTDSSWTDGTNWSGGAAPANGGWTVTDVTLNTPIITTAVLNTAADSWIGTNGAGVAGVGVIDINSGGSIDSSTKWLFVGGDNDGPGDGTLNVNSGGSYTSDNQIRLGRSGGTAALNVDGGTLSVDALDEGGGTVTITVTNGGTITATGGNIRMPIGGGSMDSGSMSAAGQIFVGGGAGASTFDLSGGTLSTGNWLPVGIGVDSVGTLNVSGGTIDTSQTGGFATIGANENAIGLVSMTNGTWTSGSDGIILGEAGNGDGTFTLDGGDLTTTRMQVALGATTTGTLNLNGGTFSTGSVELGAGASTVNLNGTPVTANADSVAFFDGGTVNLLTTTTFDTAGFNVSGDADFVGAGGITKNGAGSLSLTSDGHDIGGNIAVNAGTLTLGAGFATPFAGEIAVADGAEFGVRTAFPDDLIEPSDLGFAGTATTLNVDYVDPDFSIPTEPILVDGGNFSLSGTITVNISGVNFASGDYVLIDYSGATKVGSATWALGTLPVGITAPGGITDTGSTIEISLVAPAPLWVGNVDGNWDLATMNWEDQGTMSSVVFSNGSAATFDDTATLFGVTTTEDITPSLVKFENETQDYTLTAGGGVITGGGGLSKSGTAGLTITGMANSYTGVTTLAGGTTTVDTLTNGGVASSLGAATSDPANLVFGGGTLNYTGAATTTDRGFSTALGTEVGGLVNANDLTLTGVAGGGTGSIAKSGAGNVNFTNLTANTFGSGLPSLAVNEATWTFDGSAGALGDQDVAVPGEIWIGATPNVPANLIIQDSVVNVAGFIAISRGNGDTSTVSTLTVNDSTLTSGNFSAGFLGGEATNDVVSNITLNGSSTFDMGGLQQIAESDNAVANVTVNGTAILTGDRFILGLGADSQADVILNDSAGLVLENSWTAVGAGYNGLNGNGSITLNDNSTLTDSGEAFNIGDVDGGHGVVTVNDSATATLAGGGTLFVGKGNSDASDATGIINVNGGAFSTEGIVTLGTRIGAEGNVSVVGGVFTQVDAPDRFIVGDEGTGTLTVSGTGSVVANGVEVAVGDDATGVGTVNLETGGVLTARAVRSLAGTGTVNFNGGTLKALEASTDFLNTTSAALLAGGGIIDTDGFNVIAVTGLSGSGGLTKNGAGTLVLNGANSYTGDTLVSAGILEKPNADFDDTSTVTIPSGGTVNLIYAGTDYVAGLVINGVAKGNGVYDALTDPGFILGTGTITVGPPPSSPYDTWIDTFFPGETDLLIVGPDADPDMDGQSNKVEFALGGNPDDPSDNGNVNVFTEDSDADGNSDPELVITILVRSGTAVFAGTPSPSAIGDGCTYTIEGTVDLIDFTDAVSVVPTPIITGLPPAPVDYEYRSFSLDSSDGLPDLGFMRVDIAP